VYARCDLFFAPGTTARRFASFTMVFHNPAETLHTNPTRAASLHMRRRFFIFPKLHISLSFFIFCKDARAARALEAASLRLRSLHNPASLRYPTHHPHTPCTFAAKRVRGRRLFISQIFCQK
jgi:hypothetical protein